MAPDTTADNRTCWARVNDVETDYDTVQAAIDAARDRDVVKVAGYCTGVEERAGLTQTVYITKSISLCGGYTVTNWIRSDPVAHPTVLDAQGKGRVLFIVGPSAGSGDMLSFTLEGLSITGGDPTGLGGGQFGDDVGGAGYITNSHVVARQNRISQNTAERGGAFYLDEGSLELSDNEMISNYAHWDGGGVYVSGGTVTLRDNLIISNTAEQHGGGVCVRSSDRITLSDNAITGNAAGKNGGALYAERQSRVTLVGNRVTRNTAGEDGGGLSLDVSRGLVLESVFEENHAGEYGGAIYLHDSEPVTITDSVILRNTCATDGGGLHADASDALLRRSLVRGNTAGDDGGGVYLFRTQDAAFHSSEVLGNAAKDKGGALHILRGTFVALNTIVAANAADDGGAMYLDESGGVALHTTIGRNNGTSGIQLVRSTMELTNTILVSHSVGVSVMEASTATLAATLWGEGAWANREDWNAAGTLESGSRNFWESPAFAAPESGDYRVGPASKAVDKGLVTRVASDIDGDPRPIGSRPDLGADEIWHTYLPLVLSLEGVEGP